jgi:hypothetical protein
MADCEGERLRVDIAWRCLASSSEPQEVRSECAVSFPTQIQIHGARTVHDLVGWDVTELAGIFPRLRVVVEDFVFHSHILVERILYEYGE